MAAPATTEADVQAEVTPWKVQGKVDYNRLIDEFGSRRIDPALLARLQKHSKLPLHPWLTRGLFFSHRSLDELVDRLDKGEPFYLYTGRGPSSEALHLGHMIPFVFTKWLQEAFDVPLVIQLTDDEKFFWKDLTLEETHRLAFENSKDIIAVGFDPKKTFIFSNLDYLGHMYPVICKIDKHVTASQAAGIFGFVASDNLGKWGFPAKQAAPSFSSAFPHIFGKSSNIFCLIPCAIDQDPFFRMTRAPRLGLNKPAVIHSKFFPALQGPQTKMSASDPNSAIFMTDTPDQVRTKVRKYAFSGGRDTLEDHRKFGGDPEIDVAYQYLSVFCFDDEKIKRLHDGYRSGEVLSGQMKDALIETLLPFIEAHKAARATVTNSQVEEFMRIRPLEFRSNTVRP